MILINCPIAPPADLLEQSIKTGNTEPLEHWYIGQTSPGYSFSVIAQFVAEERSRKSKAKRAPSAKTKTRKARTTTKKDEVKSL